MAASATSYTDMVWEHFGPLEWILCVELVILISAAFFYQIAKFIAKQDRHDPLVRFYRVFWQAFKMPVTSFKELELAGAEAAARSAGMSFAGDISSQSMQSMDAVDLGQVAEAGDMPGIARPEYVPDESDELPEPTRAGKSPARGGETAKSNSTFDVRIVPGASQNRVAGIEAGEVVVEVVHEADDGQANGVVTNLISARTGIPAYRITLLRGHYKVRKTFQVDNIDQQTLSSRLQQLQR